MYQLGKRAGVEINYDVQTNWQPVDSQRLMLWTARYGKQEEFMDVLGNSHFEKQQSASHRSTLLGAVEQVGLDQAEAERFLETDELKDYVWQSYGSTIHEKGIHSIPFFVFNGPKTNGGPFRSGENTASIVRGSGDPETFMEVFRLLGKQI